MTSPDPELAAWAERIAAPAPPWDHDTANRLRGLLAPRVEDGQEVRRTQPRRAA